MSLLRPAQVRLEHMLQRLRVLQDAASTARPCRLLPRLYLSGAVEANSHHLLRYLGVTHILNATEVWAGRRWASAGWPGGGRRQLVLGMFGWREHSGWVPHTFASPPAPPPRPAGPVAAGAVRGV